MFNILLGCEWHTAKKAISFTIMWYFVSENIFRAVKIIKKTKSYLKLFHV